ncbi:LytTR family DNA-binding domain-containing protein [Hymenobacter sp. HSC-4F20]|uniref:LytR/AlgR family response regulator transcription factor n=1 Tax=Hymenobacter sp. HSC-4F20 TaxID=2864135 RepID=UPI001C73DA33|nr:LytTR family DNA-binding domain-containing protein [Hymenobacter sp. HSC-4F20]MBX0293004.1 LytTR family DNA-binding domain-containing protein [Hymenobacter sp. HSC-4F20]
MLSCFVIDDEQGAIDLLINYIKKTPFLNLVGSTTNPLEALQILRTQSIDLIFLDINMPQISGIELMPILKDKCQVVLTTAYSEYAVYGFEHNALDYLLKPISFERFLKAAQKALNNTLVSNSDWQQSEKEDDFLFVKTENKGKMIKVNFDDLIYIEGLKNYVSLYTKEERIITLLNIKDLEGRLPAKQFIRVHKSYIVSIKNIKALDSNQILLKDMKAYVPLGDTYRTNFFDVLNKNMMGSKR